MVWESIFIDSYGFLSGQSTLTCRILGVIKGCGTCSFIFVFWVGAAWGCLVSATITLTTAATTPTDTMAITTGPVAFWLSAAGAGVVWGWVVWG